jgi:hypothetical protein
MGDGTWPEARERVNADLKRHGKQIGELYEKVDEVDTRVGAVETETGGKMSSMDTKLDLLHNYSRAIILAVVGALLSFITILLTRS